MDKIKPKRIIMNNECDNIVECYSCGLFVKKLKTTKKQKLKCPRCNSKLNLENDHSFDSFYYALASLLAFVLLNLFPFVSLNIVDKQLESTLYETVLILFEQEFVLVGVLVLLSIVIAPLLNSIIIILYFVQEKYKISFFKSSFFYDCFYFFKHWGFIEVFIVSIVVTYIKLIGMVETTHFSLGFMILLVYSYLFYLSNKKFEIKKVFE